MPSPYAISIASSVRQIDAAAWDRCANPEVQPPLEAGLAGCDEGERFNPFLTYAFLNALETSKSVGEGTGWTPTHLLATNAEGSLIGAAPAYLKTHSMGEYVFDHNWADAYHSMGLPYYPKLQVAVPFTPITGRRLLVSAGHGETARIALIAGLRAWREEVGASSIHITFPTKPEFDLLGSRGFLQRTGQQFHFFNENYGDFDAFLDSLASRKRKMIRRERKEAVAAGILIEQLTGNDIKEAHWDAFFRFYRDTGARKWGSPYLTREFFSAVGAAMSERILLIMAKRNGRYIAGALNFIGADALYGRHWGAIEDHPFLHFELCYYQAIDFGIARRLRRVEAGAQGEHKLARGYRPAMTFSVHGIGDERFAQAIENYLKRERIYVDLARREYEDAVPFKKGA
ncbi:MAG TPA: GNAT family N-acetyltransferase [Methylocella sp.]|nr:GNAT family N-acetyltransferase [Methylocella sp.]